MGLCSSWIRSHKLSPSIVFLDKSPLKGVPDRPSLLPFLPTDQHSSPILQLPVSSECSWFCLIHHYHPSLASAGNSRKLPPRVYLFFFFSLVQVLLLLSLHSL